MAAAWSAFIRRFGFRTDQGLLDARTWREGAGLLAVIFAFFDDDLAFSGAERPSPSVAIVRPLRLEDVSDLRLFAVLRLRGFIHRHILL
ncbi:protein of unknown function [Methylocella tundrae]|uniref:Uncharacterized protein n=1 Tax=Methylocella tundrae TaxID=227605 RepID=A0A4U8YVY9_METTU|nr:protein of unknown function [Methylocella tundrae]